LYQVGSGEDQIWLIHVYGNTGYDFGYAYGTLLRDQIHKVLPRVISPSICNRTIVLKSTCDASAIPRISL
ncbi:unnamed protein product, partial [Rotaria sp. Silwood2]